MLRRQQSAAGKTGLDAHVPVFVGRGWLVTTWEFGYVGGGAIGSALFSMQQPADTSRIIEATRRRTDCCPCSA